MDNITLIQPFNLDTTKDYTFANVLVGTGNVTAGNANLGNLTTSNYFTGNGSLLSSITGANVSGAVSFATTANSVAGANVSGQVSNSLVAGTVYTAAQPNITSVGTLTSLVVTGNITSGNANLGNLTTANFFTGNGSLLTSLTGANVTGQVANALVAGTVYTAAQPNITSVGTLSSLSVTGNITGANLTGNMYGNGSALSSLTGANVTGQVGNSLIAGTVYTNAQPNITSVGTLTTLTVSGTTNLGAVGNITVTGGTTGQVLTTNGAGGLSWATVSGGGGGTYGDSNVATYLPTYTGNLSPGNITIPVANLHVSGGSSGQYLKTDGSGTLSWATVAGGGTSFTYTAATTPPGTPATGDQWYNTTTNRLYEYLNDGTTSYWVDIQTATIATTTISSLELPPHPFLFLGI